MWRIAWVPIGQLLWTCVWPAGVWEYTLVGLDSLVLRLFGFCGPPAWIIVFGAFFGCVLSWDPKALIWVLGLRLEPTGPGPPVKDIFVGVSWCPGVAPLGGELCQALRRPPIGTGLPPSLRDIRVARKPEEKALREIVVATHYSSRIHCKLRTIPYGLTILGLTHHGLCIRQISGLFSYVSKTKKKFCFVLIHVFSLCSLPMFGYLSLEFVWVSFWFDIINVHTVNKYSHSVNLRLRLDLLHTPA